MPDPIKPILILAAIETEAAGLKARYASDPMVDLLITGVGRERVVARLSAYLDRRAPRRVLHVGVAGGLDPSLATGRVLDFSQVRRLDETPINLPGADEGRTLLSVDAIAATPAEKRGLFEQTGADAVDMETYHAARLLEERRVPLHAIRAICDDAGMALPPESAGWVDDTGRPRAAAAVRYLLLHPHRLGAMLKLQRAMKQATASLTDAVVRTVEASRHEA